MLQNNSYRYKDSQIKDSRIKRIRKKFSNKSGEEEKRKRKNQGKNENTSDLELTSKTPPLIQSLDNKLVSCTFPLWDFVDVSMA